MSDFNYQDYIKSGRIYKQKTVLTESEQVSEKKQGYDDREDESLGARRGAEKGKKQSMKDRRDDSYGKFGKRDAEKKGKNKINKENIELDEMGDATVDSAARGLENIINGISKVLGKSKEWVQKNVDVGSMQKAMSESEQVKEDSISGEDDYAEDLSDKMRMKEDARTDAEQEGYEDGFKDAKADMKDAMSKMKVSELKAKIKENILATLNEEDEEDLEAMDADSLNRMPHADAVNLEEADEEVDVDIDVEDEVEVDAEADDIEIERKGVKAKVEVGLSPEEEIVQDSLKAAMDAADALGSQKLADQIGNTITFFTREFVVGNQSD